LPSRRRSIIDREYPLDPPAGVFRRTSSGLVAAPRRLISATGLPWPATTSTECFPIGYLPSALKLSSGSGRPPYKGYITTLGVIMGESHPDSTASRRLGWLRSWWEGLGRKEIGGGIALLSLGVATLSLTNDVFGDDETSTSPRPVQTGAPSGTGLAFTPSPVTPQPAESDRPCRTDAGPLDILDAALFVDDNVTRVNPTLDFDSMNGSALHKERDGRRFYWGRAGSDDLDPRSGGVRLRWHRQSTGWHGCAVVLPYEERGYVRTPAVANVIAGEPVTIVICMWRDQPATERCTSPQR
jgi:hypothetical protein